MTIEVTAKKVDDAINQGLKQLGADLDDVKVEVLESGGLFRKAKVRLTLETEAPKPDVPEKAAEEKTPSATEKTEKTEKLVKADTSEKPAKAAKEEKATKAPQARTARPEKTDKQSGGKSADAEQKGGEKPVERTGADKTVGEKKQQRKQPRDTEQKPNAADKAAEKSEAKPRKLDAQDKAAAERALEFVKQTLVKMGFDGATVEAKANDPEYIEITAPTGDDSLIIGRHGETLSAITYLAETGARAEKCRVNLTVDCNGYRERRAASLTAMARRKAGECAAKRRKIKLEPMERIDRRTVHNALTDDERVTTASEGKEPYRYVVILPKGRQDRQDKGFRQRGNFAATATATADTAEREEVAAPEENAAESAE
ncbi:MAG: Jag N-terminal domain-containing protein [Roseburia sp.]|nr:Jag N-terminal domain-containing protein [Roseburia sp.]